MRVSSARQSLTFLWAAVTNSSCDSLKSVVMQGG
jgi:hypothetical protein